MTSQIKSYDQAENFVCNLCSLKEPASKLYSRNYVIIAALLFANGLKTSVNQCTLIKTAKQLFIITFKNNLQTK